MTTDVHINCNHIALTHMASGNTMTSTAMAVAEFYFNIRDLRSYKIDSYKMVASSYVTGYVSIKQCIRNNEESYLLNFHATLE